MGGGGDPRYFTALVPRCCDSFSARKCNNSLSACMIDMYVEKVAGEGSTLPPVQVCPLLSMRSMRVLFYTCVHYIVRGFAHTNTV